MKLVAHLAEAIYNATGPYVAPGLLSLPFNLVNLAAAKVADYLDPIPPRT